MQLKKIEPGQQFHLADEQATLGLGHEFGSQLDSPTVIALVGDLGAGKTSFTRGLATGLGYDGNVTSPTFTLVHEYPGGRLPIFHFDFYRFDAIEEVWDIGWDEYLSADGVIVAEWADKYPEALPPETIWIRLCHRSKPDGDSAERGRQLQILEHCPENEK